MLVGCCRTRSRGTYGESDSDGALHTLIAEDLGEADVLERLGALEGTVGTCSLCVYDSLDIIFSKMTL